MPRLGGALDIVQVTDPASPASGRQFLYFKSDGNLYTKKSDGSVVQIETATTDQDIFGVKRFLNSGGKPQIQIGPGGSVIGLSTSTIIMHNATTVDNGVTYQAIITGASTALQLTNTGSINLFTAPSVAAGANLTFSPRLGVSLSGTLSGPTTFTATGQIQGPTFLATGSTGASVAMRFVGATASGAPVSGTFAVNDFIIALDTMRLWKCTSAGTPGTWVEQAPRTNMVTTDTNQTITGNKVFSGNLTIGNKALWSGTRTLPGAGNTVDVGTFTAAQGAFQLNAMFTMDVAGFSVTKTYEIDVKDSVDLANTWYKVLPQDATNLGGAANDFTLEVNRNGTTNAYTFRVRQVGAVGGTLYWQIEGWGDNTLAYTASTSTTAAPAAVSTIWSPTPLFTGPGRVGINTDAPIVEFDINGAARVTGALTAGTVNTTGNLTENGTRVYSPNNPDPNKANLFNGGLASTPLIMSPESGYATTIPYYMNDIAFNRLRGGACRVYFDGVLQADAGQIDYLFDPTSTAYNIATSGITQIIMEVDMCTPANYGTKVGYAVNESWRAKNVKIEVYQQTAALWTTVLDVTNVTYGEKVVTFGGSADNMTKVRYTFSNWNTTAFRMGQLFVLRYNSDLGSGPFVTRAGGTIYGALNTTGNLTENGSRVYSANNMPAILDGGVP